MAKLLLLASLLLIAFCAEAASEKKVDRFPHKLWLYWRQKNFDDGHMFTQLCLNNMKHFAQTSGWEVNIVDDNTVFDYLTQESANNLRFLKSKIQVMAAQGLTSQALADLHRLFLVHDNGGMWNDITSIFFRNLSWVQNPEELGLLQNTVSQQLEILMYTNDGNFAGNKSIIYDEKKQRNVYMFPGLQNWSFVAKPRAKFLRDVIDAILYTFNQPSIKHYYQQNAKAGLLYKYEFSEYFVAGSYQFQTVLQKKQREIDRNPEKFNVKYAVEYYGIWTMNAIDSAYSLFFYYFWKEIPLNRHYFYESFDTLPDMVKKTPFLKFNGIVASYANKFLLRVKRREHNVRDGACLPGTFADQYLFKYGEHLQFVKDFRQFAKDYQKGTRKKASSEQIEKYIDLTFQYMWKGAILLGIVIFCLFKLAQAADRRLMQQCKKKELYEPI